jgi:hypothetical protein
MMLGIWALRSPGDLPAIFRFVLKLSFDNHLTTFLRFSTTRHIQRNDDPPLQATWEILAITRSPSRRQHDQLFLAVSVGCCFGHHPLSETDPRHWIEDFALSSL